MGTYPVNLSTPISWPGKYKVFILSVIIGMLVSMLTILITSIAIKKSLVFDLGALLGFFLLTAVFFTKKREDIYLALFVFFITFAQIDYWFFYNSSFATSAPGIQVALPDIILFILYLLWVIRNALSDERASIWWPTALLPALFTVVIAALTIFVAINKTIAIFNFLQIAKLFLMFLWLAFNIKTKNQLKIIVIAIVASVVFHAGFAFAQKFTGGTLGLGILGESVKAEEISGETVSRFSGLLVHPTTFGTFLASMFPFSLVVLMMIKNRLLIALASLSAIMAFIALVLTLARGAIIAWFVALVVVFFLSKKNLLLESRQAKKLVGIIVAILVIITLAFSVLLTKRFTASRAGNMTGRYKLAYAAFEMIKARPILGVGGGNFSAAMPKYDPTGMWHILPHPVHNHFLFVASETGLIGFLIFMWLMISLYKTCLYCIKTEKDKFILGAAIAAFASLTVLLITGFFSEHNIVAPQQYFFWFICAVVVAIGRVSKFNKTNEPKSHFAFGTRY